MDVRVGPQRRLSAKELMFWTVVLEKTLESPLNNKEIKTVNPKGNQPWIFIGRTDAETEAPILWPPDAESRITGKHPDDKNNWWQEEKGMMKWLEEDEMVRCHPWLNGHKFEQTLGDSEEQGSLACFCKWGQKSQTWLSDWKAKKFGVRTSDLYSQLSEVELTIWGCLSHLPDDRWLSFYLHHSSWLLLTLPSTWTSGFGHYLLFS